MSIIRKWLRKYGIDRQDRFEEGIKVTEAKILMAKAMK